jgi:hypothetical protein
MQHRGFERDQQCDETLSRRSVCVPVTRSWRQKLDVSSRIPGTMMTAREWRPFSRMAKRTASERLTNRPPRDPARSRATQLPRLSLPMKNRDDFDEDRRGGSQESGGSKGSICAMFAFPYKIGCEMPFMLPSPLLGLGIAPTMCRLRHVNSREKTPPRYKQEIKG